MKKMIALILAALFVASTMPAFAGEQVEKERNLFKIIKGTLTPGEGKEKNKLRNPLPTVTCFQNAANRIECSGKAKNKAPNTEKVK